MLVNKFVGTPGPYSNSLLEITASLPMGAYKEWKWRPGASSWLQAVLCHPAQAKLVEAST